MRRNDSCVEWVMMMTTREDGGEDARGDRMRVSDEKTRVKTECVD